MRETKCIPLFISYYYVTPTQDPVIQICSGNAAVARHTAPLHLYSSADPAAGPQSSSANCSASSAAPSSEAGASSSSAPPESPKTWLALGDALVLATSSSSSSSTRQSHSQSNGGEMMASRTCTHAHQHTRNTTKRTLIVRARLVIFLLGVLFRSSVSRNVIDRLARELHLNGQIPVPSGQCQDTSGVSATNQGHTYGKTQSVRRNSCRLDRSKRYSWKRADSVAASPPETLSTWLRCPSDARPAAISESECTVHDLPT